VSRTRKRTAVFISGRGSNMEALLRAAAAPAYPTEISLVLSNKEDAAGLRTAWQAGVRTIAMPHKAYATREDCDRAMHAVLTEANIEIVALAGFMRVLSPWFCETWRGRMINIHPSLLPAFKGLDTHKRALEAGVQEHGCTVHFVTPDLDDGPTILQARVPVLKGDTEAALAARVLKEEHRIYPEALAMVARGEAAIR
jgi:phosphoribosylglycinamide formyltransferase 1